MTSPDHFEALAAQAPDPFVLDRLMQIATVWGFREQWSHDETDRVRRASVKRQDEFGTEGKP